MTDILGKYDRIDRCVLRDDTRLHLPVYLLTGENVPEEFEVDLTGDCDFNELFIVDRQPLKHIYTLENVCEFCKEYNLSITSRLENAKKADGFIPEILVGGSDDMVIDNDLSFHWLRELDREGEER